MIFTTTPETDFRLKTWSSVTQQPPELFVQHTIDEALDDWEDYQDTLRICAEVDSRKMKTYSLLDVERHLDAMRPEHGKH